MLQTAGGIERFVASFIRVNILLPCHTYSEHNIKNGSHCIHVAAQRKQTGRFSYMPDSNRLIIAKERLKRYLHSSVL